MAQENRPLLVVDDDFAYGVKHGYYPELNGDINNNVIKVMSIKDAKDSGKLYTQPSSDNENFYVYNPYISGKNYFSLNDPNLGHDFGIAKTNAIKEALRRLGAKGVKINKVVKDASSFNINADAGGNKGPIGGNAEAHYKKNTQNDFTLKIEFNDPSNKPSSYKDSMNYIVTHGLTADPFLSEWLLVLKERGKITGKERMNVTYFEEINKALKIAAKLKTPAFGVNAGFDSESIISKELEIELIVDFG